MKLGFLTGYSPERVEFAQSAGFTCLELAAGPGSPLDPANISERLAEIKNTLADHGMAVSALACYMNHFEPGREEEYAKYFQSILKLAPKLNCSVVATMTGCTPESQKSGDISQSLDAFKATWTEHARVAEGNGVKIAFENWPGGHPSPLLINIAVSPRAWEQMFDAVPSPALGLEYDPSHLARLQIDYLAPIRRFVNRIHHVHAKDTTVYPDVLDEVGYIGQGWWHYSIPSRGMVEWPDFFRELKAAGYKGDVVIEHEDPAFEGERFDNGLRLGYSYLSQLIY